MTTRLCGPNCGTDPLFDLMDPLFTDKEATVD